MSRLEPAVELGEYKAGFHYPDISVFRTRKGLSEEVIHAISDHKNEPDWMRQFRLRAYRAFLRKPMPNWGADLSDLDFDAMYYYAKPVEEQKRSWQEVPGYIRETFDRLGIPEAEAKFLAGVGAQYDSEVVYHNLRQSLTPTWCGSTSAPWSRPWTTSSPP
jgi:Fe-S cluster assembly protein SufB